MFIIKKIEQVKKIKKLLNQIANLHLEERNGHLVNTDAKKESNIEIDLRKITASELVTTIKTLEYNIYSIHIFIKALLFFVVADIKNIYSKYYYSY